MPSNRNSQFIKRTDNAMPVELKTPEQFTLFGNLLADHLEGYEEDAVNAAFIRQNPAEVALAWTTHRDAAVKHGEKKYAEARENIVLAKQAIIEAANIAQQDELSRALKAEADPSFHYSMMSENRWAEEVFQSMLKAAPDNLKSGYRNAWNEMKQLESEDGIAHLGLSFFSPPPSKKYPRGATLSSSDLHIERYGYVTLLLRIVGQLQTDPEKVQKIKADLGLKQTDSNTLPARTNSGLPTGGSRTDNDQLPPPKP